MRSWLAGIEPGFVVAHCPAAALADGSTATLRQALGVGPASEAQQGGQAGGAARLPEQGWEAAPGWVPPMVFFSGMSGEEVVGLLEVWEQYTGGREHTTVPVPHWLDPSVARHCIATAKRSGTALLALALPSAALPPSLRCPTSTEACSLRCTLLAAITFNP